ncbi:MAG: hypothetical protein FJ215_05190 [Ignavibacteria bacterium]|nr:hypothetical protein [Ignavibacteria bacterium]
MIDILIIIVLLFILHTITDFWWWIIVVPLVYAFFRAHSRGSAFRMGSLAAGILWLAVGLYQLLTAADLIARRVAEMMGLGNPWIVLSITVIVGALTGGFAASTGYHLAVGFGIRRNPPQRKEKDTDAVT